MWGPSRRFGVVASIALLAVLGIASVSPALAAEGDETGAQIEATAGYAGLYVSGLPVPVRVTIHADRLVKGYLRVTTRHGGGPSVTPGVETPIEVAGGSVKDYIVTVPTVSNIPIEGSVVVELVAGGRVHDRADVVLTGAVDTELVGVLPGLFAAKPPPQTAPLLPDAGTAKFIAIGTLELAAGAAALAPLDMIAASTDDLSRLGAHEREAIHSWIATGGRLLVDSHSDVAGLPAEWQPNTAGRTFAGFGDVIPLARENWFTNLRPSPYVGPYFFANSVMPASMGVAGDAGVKAARLSWLRAFLIVYVVVVGPIVAIALARVRRRELVWVAVPLTAFLFTGGAWFAGRENRDQVVRAHGSMVYLMPDQRASVHTFVGTMSQGGGTATVTTPDGWRPAMTTSNFASMVGEQSTTKWRDRELSLNLQPGQFGVAALAGPTSFEGTLAVSARVTGDTQITGTIRNQTGYALERVAVFASGASTVVQSIANNDTAEFTLRGAGVQDRVGPMSWPGEEMFRGGPVNNISPTNPGVVTEAMQALGVDLSANGRVVVAGWTREYKPPVEIDGRAPKNGRTAIVTTAPVDAGPKLVAVGQRVEALRSVDFRKGPNMSPSVFALSQPGVDLTGKKLEVQVGGSFTSVEIWDGSRWLLARGDLNAVPRPPMNPAATSMSVPSGAVVDGVVYVRARSFGEPLGVRGIPMILREL